jgi:biopolymer transport protein TolQ
MDPTATDAPLPDAAVAASAHGAGAAGVPDLSPLALFLAADPVVKGVMLLLVLASVACWAIVADKAVRVASLRRQARLVEDALDRGGDLGRAARARGLAGELVGAGLAEWRDGGEPGEGRAARRDRIERAMREAARAHLRRAEPGLPLLATIGSAAPFVGLFGTVWGIMRSFTAIAASGETSLAVVAPGIAEALFATAVGLAAAIPAVIAYNKLATDLGRLGQRLGAAVDRLGARLAREPAPAAAALAAAAE